MNIVAHYLQGTPLAYSDEIEVTKADYLDGLGGAARVDISQLDFQQWVQHKVQQVAATPVTQLVEGEYITYFPSFVITQILEVENAIITG